jgi:N-acetylglutamate synthase-like GNAT family acetyltransferase
MIIRFLNKKTELAEINGWLPFEVKFKDLPGHTFAVEHKNEIIAIGALRLMEGDVCFIDSFATKQEVQGKLRHQALEGLLTTLFELAKTLGFKRVFATTVEDCIVTRAEKHGCTLTNQRVLTKEL